VAEFSPHKAFAIKMGAFVAVVLVIVLAWSLIGHAIAVVIFVAALVAVVARQIRIYRMTSGGQKM
jgi:Flp pilus assembly protein TadB